ncbi:unnamed protein product, partial [Laminaria digitata]
GTNTFRSFRPRPREGNASGFRPNFEASALHARGVHGGATSGPPPGECPRPILRSLAFPRHISRGCLNFCTGFQSGQVTKTPGARASSLMVFMFLLVRHRHR